MPKTVTFLCRRFITGWLFIIFCFCRLVAYSQPAGQWTWMNGDSIMNSAGVFGTQGIASAANTPPGFYEAVGWTDQQNNLWLFTGFSFTLDKFCDLWKYDISTNMWTWVKGPGTPNVAAITGTQGVAAAANNPGSDSWCGATWVDKNGDFWLMGGSQGGSANNNLLWRYQIGNNEWTWMHGNSGNQNGVYGTQGVPDPANYPAARFESNASWTDSAGDLWLFGGSRSGNLNDLWRYHITTNTWTWMKGGNASGGSAVYGTKGVANPSNTPGGREVYAKFKDKNEDLWLFGGSSDLGVVNDWWRYNVASNQWTWMAGPNTAADTGNYGTQCVPAIGNNPQAKWENKASWTDDKGKFWVYGGFSNNMGLLADFFQFDPVTLEGTWVEGPTTTNLLATYGTQTVSSPSNYPGSKLGSVAWLDSSNRLWMFGGWGTPSIAFYNTLWRYVIDPTCPVIPTTLPVANFISSDTTFCDETGKCISFFDHSTNNPTSWHWLFPGAVPDSSNLQNPDSICYFTPGTYPVTLIVTNGGGSDTLTISPMITFGSAPPPPVITIGGGDTLYSSHAAHYQWYLNGSLIANATDSFYVAQQGGTYSVQITDGNGCNVLSNGFFDKGNSVNEVGGSEHEFVIYPNPVTESLVITRSLLGRNSSIEIYNVLGEKIYRTETTNKEEIINCKSFAAGVYFVHLSDERGIYVAKFVKE